MNPPAITYCSNIHPVEGWTPLLVELERHLPRLRSQLPWAPASFPLGLWLSRDAVRECEQEGADRFLDWCQEQRCQVVTCNGFPYGAFHQGTVKEQVYEPDWRSPTRVEYTCRLAALLDRWLPPDGAGSISTVPVGWGPIAQKPAAIAAVRPHLLATLEQLERLRQRSGKTIRLGLEPEPGCALQTAADVVAFLDRLRLPDPLRPLLGICLDACHLAVLGEEPAAALAQLTRAGVPLVKVQASSALRYLGPDPRVLRRFAEGRYLHQTRVRDAAGATRFFPDLPAALAALPPGPVREWRVHLHVPVFLATVPSPTPVGGLATTRDELALLLSRLPPATLIEAETYTWEVLPPELRDAPLADSLARELNWIAATQLAQPSPEPPHA